MSCKKRAELGSRVRGEKPGRFRAILTDSVSTKGIGNGGGMANSCFRVGLALRAGLGLWLPVVANPVAGVRAEVSIWATCRMHGTWWSLVEGEPPHRVRVVGGMTTEMRPGSFSGCGSSVPANMRGRIGQRMGRHMWGDVRSAGRRRRFRSARGGRVCGCLR